jgi:hypothetical protein
MQVTQQIHLTVGTWMSQSALGALAFARTVKRRFM